ncbi:MAG: DNA polymerase III subunit delta' [Robiginitomaculum sp.]|nr:MAG: DNA polymerase III subunit delta' [Robiginitomaculum sp.]
MSAPDYPDEPDRAPGCPAPRETYELYGHEAAERAFAEAQTSGHLHHAWLICGPRGIGKATLAYRMARRVLGAKPDPTHGVLGTDPADPTSMRIAAMSHGDLMVLRRPFDEKRKRWRAEITVEEARRMGGLFHTRAGEGGWRVCIIDAADELNLNAANAILKMLEEPPDQAMVILVAHAPGRLPATIRSRCRRLDLRPLSTELTTKITIAQGASKDEAALASKLAAGSPGRALAMVSADGAALWREIDQLVTQGPRAGQGAAHGLVRRLALAKAAPQRGLFFELLAMRLEQQIRLSAGSGQITGIEPWFILRDELNTLAVDMERLYLDPAQVIHNAIQKTWRTVSSHPLRTQET